MGPGYRLAPRGFAMVRALDVAEYLIHLAAPGEDEDIDCLSHLRLQKLLYYVQGWHLAAFGKPLFEGRIEAWTYGPVVREVYPVFKECGYNAIPPSKGQEPPSLSQRDKAFIRSVWQEYKQYSATALRDMTHKEAPWLDARGNCAPGDRCESEITREAMRAFFAPRLKEMLLRSDPRIDPAMWEAATRAIEAGRVKSTEEIRSVLRRSRPGADPE